MWLCEDGGDVNANVDGDVAGGGEERVGSARLHPDIFSRRGLSGRKRLDFFSDQICL